MMEIISSLLRLLSRLPAPRCGPHGSSCEVWDPLSDPRLARMSERELADLPFPRCVETSSPRENCAGGSGIGGNESAAEASLRRVVLK